MLHRAALIEALNLTFYRLAMDDLPGDFYKFPAYDGKLGLGFARGEQPHTWLSFETFEQAVRQFGIRDVHTGRGDFEEFLDKGCHVEQMPEEWLILNQSAKQWNDRYLALRRAIPPARHANKGKKRNLHQLVPDDDVASPFDEEPVAEPPDQSQRPRGPRRPVEEESEVEVSSDEEPVYHNPAVEPSAVVAAADAHMHPMEELMHPMEEFAKRFDGKVPGTATHRSPQGSRANDHVG